jgi:hypothetical protein
MASNENNDVMTAEEVEKYLDSFRRFFGLTDEEVIRAAERGEFPHSEKAEEKDFSDADFHSWLILLGKGDLIQF